jgi:hypothetical protein
MSADDLTLLSTAFDPLAGEELEQLFARYIRVRLEPTPAQTRRARMAVMEVAWRARFAAEQPAAARHGRRGVSRSQRLMVSAVAAVVVGLAVGSSVFAASRAGGPLFGVRIAIEDATLPSDPAARIQGEIAHAQTRLAEAYEAEVRGDSGAMTAALRAYEDEAATLGATTGGSAGQALAAVQQHRSVLLALIERASAASLPGLDEALAGSDRAIERLTTTNAGEGDGRGNGLPRGSPNGPGGAGASTGGGNGAGAGAQNGGGNNGGAGADNDGTVGGSKAAGPTSGGSDGGAAATNSGGATSPTAQPCEPPATPHPQHTPPPDPDASPNTHPSDPPATPKPGDGHGTKSPPPADSPKP